VLKCGGEEHAGEEVLAGGFEEGVLHCSVCSGGGGEVFGEFECFDVVFDVGEGVPPPGGFLEGDGLRVEDPLLSGPDVCNVGEGGSDVRPSK